MGNKMHSFGAREVAVNGKLFTEQLLEIHSNVHINETRSKIGTVHYAFNGFPRGAGIVGLELRRPTLDQLLKDLPVAMIEFHSGKSPMTTVTAAVVDALKMGLNVQEKKNMCNLTSSIQFIPNVLKAYFELAIRDEEVVFCFFVGMHAGIKVLSRIVAEDEANAKRVN